jgi:hypothetical protein
VRLLVSGLVDELGGGSVEPGPSVTFALAPARFLTIDRPGHLRRRGRLAAGWGLVWTCGPTVQRAYGTRSGQKEKQPGSAEGERAEHVSQPVRTKIQSRHGDQAGDQ